MGGRRALCPSATTDAPVFSMGSSSVRSPKISPAYTVFTSARPPPPSAAAGVGGAAGAKEAVHAAAGAGAKGAGDGAGDGASAAAGGALLSCTVAI